MSFGFFYDLLTFAILCIFLFQESHGRTVLSLAKTEENLSSSLLNITSLENSLSAAGEKFLFMQKLREFVSVICEFLQVRFIRFMSSMSSYC